MNTADTVAIVLSLLALWIAALAYWRTFGVWISIIEVKGGSSWSVDENNDEIFHLYTLTLRNLGIPLHDMSVYLRSGGTP